MARSKKKVLFICPYFYPQKGGLENYVLNISRYLVNRKSWEVIVVTTSVSNWTVISEKINGIKIYRLPILFKISNTPIHPLWYWYLKRIICQEKPDLINAHAPVPFISEISFLASKNIPKVITYHAGTMIKGSLLYDPLIRIYERFILPMVFKSAEKIVCSSEFVRDTIAFKHKHKSVVITPGVDIDIFKPIDRIKKQKGRILFVCNKALMQKMKGLFVLLKAIKTLDNVQVVIAGEPGDVAMNKVTYLGYKNPDELAEEMNRASMLVLPSLYPSESFGMVLVEALACRTPVIGSSTGGIPEVISNGVTGLLVSPSSNQALAQAIRTLLSNKKYSDYLARNGYDMVREEYNWNIKGEQTEKVFDEAIKSSKLVKVLVITKEYPPTVKGGLGVHYYELVNELKAICKITVLTSRENKSVANTEHEENLEINRILVPRLFPLDHLVFNFAAFAGSFFVSSDIIHLCSPFGMLNGFFKTKPVVVKIHTLYSDIKGNTLYRYIFFPIGKLIDTILIRRSDRVITISNFMMKNLQNKYGLNMKKMTMIHNGINQRYFVKGNLTKNEIRGMKNIPTDSQVILTVGRFVKRKGTLKLVQAIPSIVKNYPKAFFILVGGGFNEGSDYQRLIYKYLEENQLLKYARIVDWTNHEDIQPYYRLSDIFVHPAEYEPFGNVILEAMASKLAIVTTKSGGPEEIVGDKGIILEENTSEKISEAICYLLGNHKAMKSYGQLLSKEAKKYSWKENAVKTLNIYKEVLNL